MELLHKRQPYTYDMVLKRNIWDATMVSRILQNEFYAGTLICHKSERNKINKTFRFTDADEQFRHENFVPAIITKELWEQARELLAQRKESHARAGKGHTLLRYGGMLRCEDCGRTFIGKRIKLKSGDQIEYVCDTYHRYGKEHCTSHGIRENLLDQLIIQELQSTKRMYQQNWDRLQTLIDRWLPKQSTATEKIRQLTERVSTIEEEMEAILMERIRDKANAERYDHMIQKREDEIAAIKKQITELENIEEVLKKRQASLKRDIRMMDDILAEGHISEAHLRLLVEKIYISERDGKLDVDIHIKAPFRTHFDIYEDGEVVESGASMDFDYDRLWDIIDAEFREDDLDEVDEEDAVNMEVDA
jgi:hypothetical protein